MEPVEIVIWSAMSGVLFTLAMVALADALTNRSVASMRGLMFVLLPGSSCIVMTDLPELLFPSLSQHLITLLKATLGPLSGAVALTYLGKWLGGRAQDPVVHRIIVWGSSILITATVVLVILALRITPRDFPKLLFAAAMVNGTAVVLALITSGRAAALGDPLARWMLVACLFLAGATTGLYLHGLEVKGYDDLGSWIFTALCTTAYFLLCTGLAILRNRQNRKLARLAGLKFGADPATGLPTGQALLNKVAAAFWRNNRMHGECVVVALHLRNLYALDESCGHGFDQQILAAMSARILRTVGFRSVVGLYHPLCFVVVLTTVKRDQTVQRNVTRLRQVLSAPLQVESLERKHYQFVPQLGVGMVTVTLDSANPAAAIDEAEQLAIAASATDPNTPALAKAEPTIA